LYQTYTNKSNSSFNCNPKYRDNIQDTRSIQLKSFIAYDLLYENLNDNTWYIL